jgi:glycosyltransferase involved in cell wall biosynthesis
MNSSIPPKFSIIIDNYNYGRFLAQAIESALSQTYSNLEIVVVDDGSTDHSREVIAQYGGKVISVFKKNGGQASAFNAGFAACSGEFVCFLDADDVMLPQRVAEAVNLLDQYPQAAWCYHQLNLMDEDGNLISGSSPERKIYEFDLRSRMQRGSLKRLPLPLPGIVGLTFRRSHLEKILPMPESEGIFLNDSYVQFASCAIAKGVASSARLETQRIHGSNAYTRSANQAKIKAQIHVLTAYWLRINFPTVYQFSNCFFAPGLARAWWMKAPDEGLRRAIRDYQALVSLHEYPSIWMRALYHSFKL